LVEPGTLELPGSPHNHQKLSTSRQTPEVAYQALNCSNLTVYRCQRQWLRFCNICIGKSLTTLFQEPPFLPLTIWLNRLKTKYE